MSSAITSFKIRELLPLGSGGMGTTYLACSSATGSFERLVVMKRLHDHMIHDAEARQRLLEEAQLAGYVHHSNVVSVQHVGTDARGDFLVLDFVDGTSLKQLMRQARPEKIPEPIALRLILDCLAGLQAIHTTTDNQGRPLNILHRDVTPENILIGLDGVARLSDFGIAKSVRSAVQTAPLQLVGKLPFMAPEYIDRGDVGPPLDVYAVGVSLWRLLAGRPPWVALEEAQMLVRILTEGVPELPTEAAVGPRLREIVARACAMQPENRFKSAREMASAIESLGAEHPIAERGWVGEFVRELIGPESGELRARAAQILETPTLPPPPLESFEPEATTRTGLAELPTRPVSLAGFARENSSPDLPPSRTTMAESSPGWVSSTGRAQAIPPQKGHRDFVWSLAALIGLFTVLLIGFRFLGNTTERAPLTSTSPTESDELPAATVEAPVTAQTNVAESPESGSSPSVVSPHVVTQTEPESGSVKPAVQDSAEAVPVRKHAEKPTLKPVTFSPASTSSSQKTPPPSTSPVTTSTNSPTKSTETSATHSEIVTRNPYRNSAPPP